MSVVSSMMFEELAMCATAATSQIIDYYSVSYSAGVRLLAGGFPRSDAGGAGLWPPIVNVAPKARVSVNATCGQAGREEYCKMSDASSQSSSR